MKHLSIDQAYDKMNAGLPKTASFPVIWEKVRPFVLTLSGFLGKKLKPWFAAFIAGVDKYVESL